MINKPDPSDSVGNGTPELDGDQLLRLLAALANPHRLRIVAALTGGREYVSRLARRIGLGRALLHMHLQRLEHAGVISGTLEISDSGKAMKYYEVTPFAIHLTPTLITTATETLSKPGHTATLEDPS